MPIPITILTIHVVVVVSFHSEMKLKSTSLYIHMKPIDSQKCHKSLSASAQSRSLSGSETQNIGGAKSKDLKNKKVF